MASCTKLPNGKYKILSCPGRDKTGKQYRKAMTYTPTPGMSKREIERELQKVKFEFDEKIRVQYNREVRGIVSPDAMLFREYAPLALEKKFACGMLTKKTYSRYLEMLERVNEFIGDRPLGEINAWDLDQMTAAMGRAEGVYVPQYALPRDEFFLVAGAWPKTKLASEAKIGFATVQRALQGEKIAIRSARKLASALGKNVEVLFSPVMIQRKPLASKTIHEHLMEVRSVYEQAIRYHWTSENPAVFANDPGVKSRLARSHGNEEKQCFSLEFQRNLIRILKNEDLRWRCIIMLLMETGYRRGSIIGIKIDNINVDKCTIYMQETVLSIGGKKVPKATSKNEASHQVLHISLELMGYIQEWLLEREQIKEATGERWTEKGYLFPGMFGDCMHPDSVNKYLDRLCRRYGLEHINPHKFRHSKASTLLNGGMSLTDTARVVGDRPQTILRVYAHPDAAVQQQSVESTRKLLNYDEIFQEEKSELCTKCAPDELQYKGKAKKENP